MKSRLLAVAVVTLAPCALSAQVTFGVRAGMNVSTIVDVDLEGEVERLTGLHFAGTATVALADRVGLQVGLAWSPKGASLPIERTGENADLRLGYIDVPVLLRLRAVTSANLGIHVLAGGTFSYNHSCSLEASTGETSQSFDCDPQGIDPATVDYGLSFGGGLSVALGGSGARLVADGIYTLGLADLVVNDDARNRVLALLAGVQIPVG